MSKINNPADTSNFPDKTATETISGDWNFTNVIQAANGTESLPSYTFNSDTNTGMYRIGTDNIGFSTTGNEKLSISSVIKCKTKFSYDDVMTITPSSDTPDVRSGNIFEMAGTRIPPTVITNFVAGTEGQMITFKATNDNITISNGLNIQLQGSTNFAMANGDNITLVKFASKWEEVSRMTV